MTSISFNEQLKQLMPTNMDPVAIRRRIKAGDFPSVRLKLPIKCRCDTKTFISGHGSLHSTVGCAHMYECRGCGREVEVFQFYCKDLARERDNELND